MPLCVAPYDALASGGNLFVHPARRDAGAPALALDLCRLAAPGKHVEQIHQRPPAVAVLGDIRHDLAPIADLALGDGVAAYRLSEPDHERTAAGSDNLREPVLVGTGDIE